MHWIAEMMGHKTFKYKFAKSDIMCAENIF